MDLTPPLPTPPHGCYPKFYYAGFAMASLTSFPELRPFNTCIVLIKFKCYYLVDVDHDQIYFQSHYFGGKISPSAPYPRDSSLQRTPHTNPKRKQCKSKLAYKQFFTNLWRRVIWFKFWAPEEMAGVRQGQGQAATTLTRTC